MTALVGVDLGATNLRVVVADEAGTVRGSLRRNTPDGADEPGLRDALFTAIADACDRAGFERSEVTAAGIASVGPIDGGGIRDPANLPAIDRLDVVEPTAEWLGATVHLLNDATAGAIGEAAAGRNDDLVYLTLSTGVGAGVIAEGTPLVGHRSNAGEVGHITLDPDARVTCGCGGTGHWEAFCGGANVVAHARSIAADGVETGLDLDSISPAVLLESAGMDPLATRLVDRVATWNAIGVATVVHAYDPARIVVGGGVALNHPETVVEPIRERLPAHCQGSVPPIELPRFGADAPVRGALESVRPD